MGSKPETKDDWFWKPLKTLYSWTIGLIVMAIMIPAIIIAMLIIAAITFLLENLPILEYILWLIIRAIIYILTWIILALTLIDMAIMWTILLVNFIVMDSVIIGTLNFYFFGFEFSSDDNSFSMKYKESIQFRDIKFFNLYLPVIRTEIWENETLISWEESHIVLMKTELSTRNDSLIEDWETINNSTETAIPYSMKNLLIGRIAAGASLPIIGGGISIGFFGLVPLIEKGRDALRLVLFYLTIANIITSAWLFIRNIIDHENQQEENYQQDLFNEAYLYGFTIGCLITTIIFSIAAAIGGGVQKLLEKPQKKIQDIVTLIGGLGFGFLSLGIKVTEISFRAISNLLGANIIWVVLGLLLGSAIFTTIGMIVKKDIRTAKWLAKAGMVIGVITIICSLIFVTTVPKQNQVIITNLI